LFAECDFVCLMAAQCSSQQLAQVFNDAHRTLTIVITNEHGDRVECIEEKVWIQLCLQRSEASAGELFGESCYLHFAFARIDEITSSALDPNDAEINSDAERQRNKDPAQPLDAELKPDFGSTLQDQTQHLTARGPGNAEQEREEEVQYGTADKMRACERPLSRDCEHAGCEKRIKQPVAELEQQLAKCCGFPALQSCLGDAIDDGEAGGTNPASRDNHPWTQARHSHVATVSSTTASRNTVHVSKDTA